jgi:hypothetical protein
MVFGGSPIVRSALCPVVVRLILLFRNLYRTVEHALLVIVALLSASFILSAIISKPERYEALGGRFPVFRDRGRTDRLQILAPADLKNASRRPKSIGPRYPVRRMAHSS